MRVSVSNYCHCGAENGECKPNKVHNEINQSAGRFHSICVRLAQMSWTEAQVPEVPLSILLCLCKCISVDGRLEGREKEWGEKGARNKTNFLMTQKRRESESSTSR